MFLRSLLAGVVHLQVSPLLLEFVEASDVLSDVREEPVSLRKEDGSDDLRTF